MLTKSKFRPAWWLRNPHAQTLWAAKVHPAPWPQTRIERITTADDDFLDLNHCESEDAGHQGPIVVIFHGLTGSINSRYVRSLMAALQTLNIPSVLMHFRGCSGQPNLTAGSYHSGHTDDIELVIQTISDRHPGQAIIAAGYSLGANALLKYLAKRPDNPLRFAVAVCPPLVLAEGAKKLNRGFSKLYQWTLVRQMKKALRRKDNLYPHLKLAETRYEAVTNFFEFDHQITAPLHGFDSGADYYQRASTLPDLINIDTPTHIIFAHRDPFFTEHCIPRSDKELSSKVTFEVAEQGGHVAFISGRVPLMGHDWLRDRVASLIQINCRQRAESTRCCIVYRVRKSGI